MSDDEKIRVVFPTDFRLRLSNVGTNTFNGSCKIMTDTNALKLSFRAVNVITDEFAGKEKSAKLQYGLACLILSGLNYPKDLEKHISEIGKQMEDGAWELKKQKDVNP